MKIMNECWMFKEGVNYGKMRIASKKKKQSNEGIKGNYRIRVKEDWNEIWECK